MNAGQRLIGGANALRTAAGMAERRSVSLTPSDLRALAIGLEAAADELVPGWREAER